MSEKYLKWVDVVYGYPFARIILWHVAVILSNENDSSFEEMSFFYNSWQFFGRKIIREQFDEKMEIRENY